MRPKVLKHLIYLLALLSLSTTCDKEQNRNQPDFYYEIHAEFTVTPEEGTTATQFNFSALGSYYRKSEPSGDLYYFQCDYRWDFDYQGDGDIVYDFESESAYATHVYQHPGTYTVRFEIAYDPNDIIATTYARASKTIVVTEAPSSNPTAYFELVNTVGYPKIWLFSFLGGCTDLEDPEEALMVRWDWEGDGIYDTEFSTDQLATHTFNNPGIYDVTIQVKDTDELTDEVSHQVTVLGPGGQPCPDVDPVIYGGETYPTVLIGDQCWLNKNLNIGTMILNSALPSQNTPDEIIEKYCYSNSLDSCEKYGGLYNWNEMMQYNNEEGSRGICPNGWHIPTDEEWKELEGEIDSHYGYPDEHWDQFGPFRGWDLGINIRSQSNWYNLGIGYDKFGFNAQPGGQRENNSEFEEMGLMGYYWTSTSPGLSGNSRWISTGNKVARELDQKEHGYAVRCIMD